MEENSLVAILAIKKSADVVPEVNFREHVCFHQAQGERSEE